MHWQYLPCFENECDEFGYAVLLCKETGDLKQYHAEKANCEENRNAAITTAAQQANYHGIVVPSDATIPVTPTFPNPGQFIFRQWLDWQGTRSWKNIAWWAKS